MLSLGSFNSLFFDSSDNDEYFDATENRRTKVYRQRINFSFTSEAEFLEMFRMKPEKVQLILEQIGQEISHPTGKSAALCPKKQLCIALHWLGSGAQYHTVADMHGVHKSTTCRAIKRVVSAINTKLLNKTVSWPSNIEDEVSKFYQIAYFPCVVGAVDGCLINIDAPSQHEAAFVDRYGDHSLNCMFVCGANYQFFFVNANWPGSVHDNRVLRNSVLFRKMEEGLFSNYVLLGDSGYGLRKWLMPPLRNDPQSQAERLYNTRHKSTRRIIECALGILIEKFPCLNRLRVNPVFAANIVKCCATLCNIARNNGNDYYSLPEQNIEKGVHEEMEEYLPEQQPSTEARIRQNEIMNMLV